MIIMHNKTGDLYQLIDDECKAKINGEWIDAVLYQGKDKETGDMKNGEIREVFINLED